MVCKDNNKQSNQMEQQQQQLTTVPLPDRTLFEFESESWLFVDDGDRTKRFLGVTQTMIWMADKQTGTDTPGNSPNERKKMGKERRPRRKRR